ncbi:MAG: bifunctional DNA-formamidopyrimidine glycosylase/DNA-(apurinic or apyrimidinic site) lyase [Gemmatimonadota bacterium]|nr:bifunctional DNA-formamidopyrimidine glycosylase/DNA-(apurinic or apyrimidinic site) lyase [Gemmatimonadota bacterium]
MPELPEVETIRAELEPQLTGRTIVGVRVYHDDLILGGHTRRAFSRGVRDRTFLHVGRRAKYLLFTLGRAGPTDEPERIIRVQLRMSGKFWLGATRPDPEEFRHPGIELRLDDGRVLFYDDTRRLGGFDLLTPAEWAVLESRIGPEPLASSFSAARFGERFAGSRAPIKNALLDQRRIAGVGNIYASEALFRARVDPRRAGGSLDTEEVVRLHRAVRAVLREALSWAGTTFRSYRAVNGRSGSFQSRLRVYGREDEACRRCGDPVERVVQAGRSTFFCPSCQS